MDSVQYKRTLSCLFNNLYMDLNAAETALLSEGARDELLMLTTSLPMHWMNQKSQLSGHVYATDASEDGGGACQSTGLSKWGHSRVHTRLEGAGADPVLAAECFAGFGGLKQALDLLGLVPMGHVGIDSSAECGKVFRQHCRHALWYKNIEDITCEEVKEWRKHFAKATKVILSGGWPCINHSQLNPRRGGAEAASSQLLDKMLLYRSEDNVEGRVKTCGLPTWSVLEFYENVVMDNDYTRPKRRKLVLEEFF